MNQKKQHQKILIWNQSKKEGNKIGSKYLQK